MLFLKKFKDAKFVVDGNAFQTFITLSTKNFCLMLAVHLGLNSTAIATSEHIRFLLFLVSLSFFPPYYFFGSL